jgi:hypothetical protein
MQSRGKMRLGLFFRLKQAELVKKATNIERQQEFENYFYTDRDQRWEMFKLYFLGFEKKWFLVGLRPVRLRAMNC